MSNKFFGPATASKRLKRFEKDCRWANKMAGIVNESEPMLDLHRIAGSSKDDGKPISSPEMISVLRGWGYDPFALDKLPDKRKWKLIDKLIIHYASVKKEITRLDNEIETLSSEFDDLMHHASPPSKAIKEVSMNDGPLKFMKMVHSDDTAEADNEEVGRRMGASDLKLERPQGSSMHHLCEYVATNKHLYGTNSVSVNLVEEIKRKEWQSFVIEHDWAAAFEGATDFDGGDIKMPYSKTCFEFRINGIRVLMFVYEETSAAVMAVGVNGRWYVNANQLRMERGALVAVGIYKDFVSKEGTIKKFMDLVSSQVRAVCIMLDSKIAERETVRVSAKLNEQRKRKGKALLSDYHVVSLSRKFRAKPAEDHVVTPGSKRRLHFRRGHWRHYDNHRTWINWMLVGDPDLGFVDKHYKL